MSKHTPGPWEAGDRFLQVPDLNWSSIAEFRPPINDIPISWEEYEANKKLVQSAPDMFDALKLVQDTQHAFPDWWYENNYDEVVDNALKKARDGKGLMIKTIWVRPAGFGQFLVSRADSDLKEIVDAFFNSNDWEAFVKNVNPKICNEEFEDFDERDMKEFYTAALAGELDGETEIIEYKLIEMSKEDFEGVSEFSGW